MKIEDLIRGRYYVYFNNYQEYITLTTTIRSKYNIIFDDANSWDNRRKYDMLKIRTETNYYYYGDIANFRHTVVFDNGHAVLFEHKGYMINFELLDKNRFKLVKIEQIDDLETNLNEISKTSLAQIKHNDYLIEIFTTKELKYALLHAIDNNASINIPEIVKHMSNRQKVYYHPQSKEILCRKVYTEKILTDFDKIVDWNIRLTSMRGYHDRSQILESIENQIQTNLQDPHFVKFVSDIEEPLKELINDYKVDIKESPNESEDDIITSSNYNFKPKAIVGFKSYFPIFETMIKAKVIEPIKNKYKLIKTEEE